MLANRLVLVIVALVILVHADDSRSEIDPQQDGISVVSKTTSTNERRRVEKEVNADGRRQGRMALHTEAPLSKAKREQALRSILAARRRRYQGSRLTEVSKTPRIPKPVLVVPKDSLDMLEAEETRHGVYVMAPIGDEVSLLMGNDEDDDNLEFVSKENVSKLTTVILKMPAEEASPVPPENIEAIINETMIKNISQSSLRSQQIVEHENRRKNIVAMPESLYNHFRPVESNIPVEDMSQFLYFGQKLHPDANNSSRSNNSIIDATSTSSSVTSPRRRYSMKRFSTTTSLPVPRLEDMINEEMNIAIERGTVERNKIPKVKNVFRSPGSGVYFRKSSSRTTYPTIVSNVIPTTDATSRNSSFVSLSDNKRETVLSRNSGKSIVGDPSAHAKLDQVAKSPIAGDPDTGSYTRPQNSVNFAHGSATENSADSTQFLGADVSRNNETFESAENNDDDDDDDDDDKIQAEQSTLIKVIDENVSQSDISGMKIVSSTSRDVTIDGITTWQTIQSNHESTTILSPSNETEAVKMTTSKDQAIRESKITSNFPTTTNLGHSSLRIVVTEPIGHVTVSPRIRDTEESTVAKEESVIAEEEPHEKRESSQDHKRKETPDITRYRGEARYTVNLADSTSHDYFQISKNTKILPPTVLTSFLPPNATNTTPISVSPIVPSTTTTVPLSSTLSTSKPHGTSPVPLVSTIKREQKQPHAYAYEITNVTRLLRNYTGPGPNNVENTTKHERRRNESGREVYEARRKETMTETENNQQEEKRKSGINKKQKLVDQLDRGEVRDKSVEGEEVRVKVVERGPALTRTSGSGNSSGSSSSSIREIRNGGRSVQPTSQRPLPLLLLLLPTTPRSEASSSASGGTVKEARTPGELSAGTDVGEVTASISGDVGVGVSRYDSRVIDDKVTTNDDTLASLMTTSSTIEVNAATIENPRNEGITTSSSKQVINNDRDSPTENSLGISTLRWNHTLHDRIPKNRTDSRSNERRYLRKSSSAVLNQRTIEDSLIKEVKRRRGTFASGLSSNGVSVYTSNFNNRRNKVWRNGDNEDRGRTTSLTRSMENRTSVIGVENSNDSFNDTVIVDEPSEDAIGERMENVTEVTATMTEMEIEVTTIPSTNEDRVESSGVVIDDTERGTTVLTPSTLESPIKISEVKDSRDNRTSDATSFKVNEDVTRKIEKPVMPTNASDAAGVDSTSLTLTSLAMSSENEEIATTSATPGFPVTPIMLPEQSSTGNKSDEVSEVSEVSEVKAEIDEDEKLEAHRPFGIAKDLDPSEIQKRYRSQTTLKPEQAMTTILPEIDDSPSSGTRERSRTASPVNSSVTRKPVGGGERSPEVRGRNLSDKSKDKDDVLPIMELYNTSRIFNGTNEDSANTPRTAELPDPVKVNETRHVNEPVLSKEDTVTTTTTTTTATTTTAKTTTMVNGESPKNERKNDRRQDETIATRKNNGRQSESRDETNDYSTSTRSSNNGNFYNNTQINRMRNRPGYYQTQQPEFVGYRPELNGSFYEPGLISVSPRESINISEVITKRHDGDNIATQETVAVVSYILATLVVFPIAVGVGLILRRLIIRNRKVLEESDTSSEISCRKDALNLENGDFKTSIEKAITKLPRIQYLCHEAEKPPPPPSQESRWEFPRDKLRLQTVLGQGNFGQVWKAEADDLTGHQGTTRLVAVKTVKEGASAREKEDLVRELEIMQQLGNHPNVVTLLGCCTEDEPHYLILEYVMYGKLLAYLRDHRTRQDFYNFSEDSAALTSRDLTVFGYCVARGMEYLASKKIIHRDLAARNVLVDHNKLCKIADFGMSRFANDEGEIIEARHGRNALPIRWMAPESLIYSLFTTKTDVWSFGILMWEIVTLGSTPYPDMAAREVMRNVQNGYRLERPSHCRSELFRVIARCWHADPDRRPEFQTLRRDMAQLLEDGMNGHYVDLESFASECTD